MKDYMDEEHMSTELNIPKLIEAAQELIADEQGRLRMAASGQMPVQEIEVYDHRYQLSVLLEYIPTTVAENGELTPELPSP
jgi:hypothetical protein